MFTLTITDKTFTEDKLPRDFWDRVFALSYNGIDIQPVNSSEDEPIPLAWDAGFTVQDQVVKIDGGLGPSGFGKVSIECPRHRFHDYYKLSVEPKEDSERVLRTLLNSVGFTVEEVE